MKKIKLTQNKYTLVDDEDFEWLNSFKWSAHKVRGYYAERRPIFHKGKYFTKMHRLILNAPKNLFVDHIDGNTLNNQKSNLRLCTNMENLRNSKIYKSNTTGYKGVWKHRNLYYARLRMNKKCIYSKSYQSIKEAAYQYNILALKYFGKFSKLNII